MLPGQAHIGEQWPSQPQLPASCGDQTRPSVGGRRVARTDGGPAERLFKEAEGVFHREAPQVPTPEDAQVGREWTADPGCVKRSKTNRRFDEGRTRKTAETVQPERLKSYSDFG
jgi:hypothetical protein